MHERYSTSPVLKRNLNQSHRDVPPLTYQCVCYTETLRNAGEDMEKREPLCAAVGMKRCAATIESRVVPQESKNCRLELSFSWIMYMKALRARP